MPSITAIRDSIYRDPDRDWLLWDLDPNDPNDSESAIQAYKKMLDKVFKRIKNEINEIDFSETKNVTHQGRGVLTFAISLTAMTALIDKAIMAMQPSIREEVKKQVIASYKQGWTFENELVAPIMGGAPFVIGKRDSLVIDILTDQGMQSIIGVTDDLRQQIGRNLAEGLMNGEGVYDLTKRVQSTSDDFNWARSELIARTEAVAALNKASTEYYKSRNIKQWRWLSAGDDGRTCEDCLAKDGKIYDVGDTEPPEHPSCRCTSIPVIEGLNDESTQDWRERRGLDEAEKSEIKQPQEPVTIKDSTTKFIDTYKGSDVENAVVYDKNGSLLHTVSGNRDEVSLPKGNLDDAIVIHNHPDQSIVSVSPEDVLTAKEKNLSEISAVGTSGDKMTIYRPAEGWGEINESRIASAREGVISDMKRSGEFNRYVNDEIKTGRMSIDEAAAELNNQIVKETYSRLGLKVDYAKR